MTGLLSSEQVIAEMGIQLDRRFRDEFLGRRLDLDCARMRVTAELFEVLRAMRAEAMVVIATDNMDCFARAFHNARHPRRRRAQPWETLAGANNISEIISALKSWLDTAGQTASS